MMQLSHIALVSWHLFEAEDISIVGNTGVIGENRSGKSTLLDAINVILNGAAGRQKLNQSASVTGERKSGRSIHGYCLGRLGEGDATLRSEAQTYISLSFIDPVGQRRPVTIGVAMTASHAEATHRVQSCFIADGAILTTDDYVEPAEGDERRPRSWAKVRERLEAMEEAGQIRLHHYHDETRLYIREYMRLLMTGGRYNEEKRFLRSFTNAIAFEPMKSATDFVREFILERNDIKIGQLRESISAYRLAADVIAKLTRRAEALKTVEAEIAQYAAALADRDEARWLGKRATWLNAEQKLAERRQALRRAELAREAAAGEITRINDELARLEEGLSEVEATIAATGIKDKQATLEERKRRLCGERQAVLKVIAAGASRLERLTDLLRIKGEIPGHEPVMTALGALKNELARTPRLDWPRDPRMADADIARIIPLLDGVEHAIDTLRSGLVAELAQLQREAQENAQVLSRLARGERILSPPTEAMCARLRREGLEPKVVCEFLDMKDEAWRGAAEAMLGRDREAIIVDKTVVDKAILIRRREKSDFPGVRIVNTRKLGDLKQTIQPGTLASIISSTDPIAMAFVTRRVGNVRLARSQEELHAPGRAVMQDGTYDDGLVVETREVPDRKIGAKASGFMRQRAEARAAQLAGRIRELERETGIYGEAVRRIHEARTHFAEAEPLTDLVDKLSDIDGRLGEADGQLAQLGGIVDQSLYERKQRLQSSIANLRTELTEQNREEASQIKEIQTLTGQIGEGPASEGSLAHRAATRESYGRIRREIPYPKGRFLYRERLAKQRTHYAVTAWAKAAEVKTQERFQIHELRARDLLNTFFVEMGERSLFSLEAPISSEIRPWVLQEIAFVENNALVKYHDAAEAAAKRASAMLRNSFVAELKGRVDTVRREINELNHSLKPYPLHHERYSFHPHFDEAYGVVQDLLALGDVDDETLVTLFTDEVPENHTHAQALEAVRTILGDKTFDFENLEDYRRFFTFTLIMEDVTTGRKTQWETRRRSGSGAEQQVPFYVAIGAALASVYHGRSRGLDRSKLGMGLAVFDEAFSKMDTVNQRQMLEFYRNIGLQTIIASPMINRGIIYETMDSVVEVYRLGDQAETDCRVIKERTRSEMHALNPDNMTREEILKAAAE